MRKPVTEPPRRFYKSVDTAATEGGFSVLLDGRTPRSPSARPLILPTESLAETISREWSAQGVFIDLDTMRATRLAFTALDGIAAARGETAEEIVNYAGCDVLCYRAVGPASFVAKQARLWDPVLEWAGRDLGVTLTKTTGVIHYAQPQTSLDRVRELARDQTDFGLAGLAFATALFGSAVLALAVQAGQLDGLEAFALSRLDEAFQEEQWGIDAEAAERTARLELDATMIGIWFESLR